MLPYDTYGNRENRMILLLHGAAALDTFTRQYEMSRKYFLVVPHLYGAGKSVEKMYEPTKMVQELEKLMEALNRDKMIVIGHSLGAQLAIMLVSRHPEWFFGAVFLSAWVNPMTRSVRAYCGMAPLAAKALQWGWLVRMQASYWHYTKEQATRMEEYVKKLTPERYKAFFEHTMRLKDYPEYEQVNIPMLEKFLETIINTSGY